jgi:ketosteroid isomerase-like protein
MGLLMARAFTPTLLVVILTSCSSEMVTRPAPPPVNWSSLEAKPASFDAGTTAATSKKRAAANAYLKALASSEFADLGPILDEDAHFAFAGFKDAHGRDNVVRMHEVILGAFESRSFIPSRRFLTDSSQVIEWTMTGVHRTSKKPVVFKGLSLLWMKDDGTIANIHLYFDEALVNAQVGIGPKALQTLPRPQPPSGPPQEIEQSRSAEEAANVATVRASLDALENKDESAYVGTMTDDVEVTTLETTKPMRGKAEARAYVKAMHKAIAQFDASVDDIWGVGPFVVVEYHVVGEQRGPIGFIPAQKDNLLKMFVVDVAELRGGKIAHLWRYDNPAQILATP